MLPPFSEYGEEHPSDFYLANDSVLLSSADGVWLVEGQVLPVHSVLLKERTGLFRQLLNGGLAAAAAGIPLAHHLAVGHEVMMSDQLPPDSPRSLEGYTLKRVVHFLRFLYHPTEVAAIDFQLPGAAKSLSACVRLASALDVPALLEALDARMQEAVDAHKLTVQRLMDWAGVADECGLTPLWTKCVHELAVTLARARQGVKPRTTSKVDVLAVLGGDPEAEGTKKAVQDMVLLRDLTPRTQLAVMATLLASLRQVAGDPSLLVPSECTLTATLPALQPSESPTSEPSP